MLTWLPLAVTAATACAYVLLTTRTRSRHRWPPGRTVAFLTGCALVVVALSPGFDRYADADFGGHAAQHLILAMVAPLALVLGAPVTLLLGTLPHRQASGLGRFLHRRGVRLLTHPALGVLLSSGGLIALYVTPLYTVSTQDEGVHVLVHAHLLASGVLFSWSIAGPDPAPGRPSVRARLVALGVAVAMHSAVAQLLYAGLLVDVHEPVVEMQAAGSLMYFGGDLAEVALAVALLVTWRPGRPAARPRRVGTLRPWLSRRTPSTTAPPCPRSASAPTR